MPRIGWQLDPFGHSTTQARIFKEMGYEALFFQRYNHLEKNARFANGTQIFEWEIGNGSTLLTLTFDQYTSQGPFQYDGHWNSVYSMPNVSGNTDKPRNSEYL